MKSLLDRVLSVESPSVTVVGDVMLDELIQGDAERLSPDAPVPVLDVRSRQWRCGGAANVAKCAAALGARVRCIGAIGEDVEGRKLCELLSAPDIDVAGIRACSDRPTTVKRSIVGLAQHRHPQKMFRLDEESRAPLSDGDFTALLATLVEILPTTDIVCLEDYGKGVLGDKRTRAIIQRCVDVGVEVVVDPANTDDYECYRGATIITPNRSELERAMNCRLDDADPVDGAMALAEDMRVSLDLHAVVVTLDRHGAVLAERGAAASHLPTRARSVYDVTGAGDMVVSAMSVGRGGGLSWSDAVELSNVAAGLEVEAFGATPVPISHVHRELLREGNAGKIRSREELDIELEMLRDANRRIVLTNGCFDVIHAGHVAYLREAARRGDILIVGINSDEQVRVLKGEDRPIYPLRERMEILGELQCVNIVVPFEEETAEALIRSVRPDVFVKGGDYAAADIIEYPLLKELGIGVEVLAHRPGLGSTAVVEQLRGDM